MVATVITGRYRIFTEFRFIVCIWMIANGAVPTVEGWYNGRFLSKITVRQVAVLLDFCQVVYGDLLVVKIYLAESDR